MALLDQLLVDAEDADEDVLFVLAGTAGLDDGVVEADGVHVESFLDLGDLLSAEPVPLQADAIDAVLHSGSSFVLIFSVDQVTLLFLFVVVLEVLRKHGIDPLFDHLAGHVDSLRALLETMSPAIGALNLLQAYTVVRAYH